MSYDNAFNGALFATRDTDTLAGPFQLTTDGERLRVVCKLNGAGDGRHALAVYAERKDGKGLKAKPVATGWMKRFDSRNESAPVAKGHLANSSKRVNLAIWRIQLDDGRHCYQIKPDKMEADIPELPEL